MCVFSSLTTALVGPYISRRCGCPVGLDRQYSPGMDIRKSPISLQWLVAVLNEEDLEGIISRLTVNESLYLEYPFYRPPGRR